MCKFHTRNILLVTLLIQVIFTTNSEEIDNPTQLNCTDNTSICKRVCREVRALPYSSTFCDPVTGSCVCDCRDTLSKDCVQTPFTPCFQNCVTHNPNPDIFLYRGGNCPAPGTNGTSLQCACECTFREDYVETNDI